MSEAVAGARAASAHPDFKPEEKRVIFASSLGTVFEWYDFYLYATLAPFFAALFFPKGNDTAALLSSFATYAAGFLVRPVRRSGVRAGRRHRRQEIYLSGDDHGHGRSDFPGRPVADLRDDRLGSRRSCWCSCDCSRGWRWAESTAGPRLTWPSTRPRARRGYDTSWIQTTATLGFFLALIVIMLCRVNISKEDFAAVGLAHSRSWYPWSC